MNQEANEHDDGSVWKFSRADQSWVVKGGTGGRDDSEGEVLSETQILVTSEEPQGETDKKWGDAAVSVGLGKVEDK